MGAVVGRKDAAGVRIMATMDGAVEQGSPLGTPWVCTTGGRGKGSGVLIPSHLLLFCLPRETFGDP